MSWRKLGLVWGANGSLPALLTHAANPTVEALGGDALRVYFAGRDALNRSSIGSIDLCIDGDGRWALIDPLPKLVLSPGPVGTFDDSGCVPACVLDWQGETFLYYLGWNLGVTVPWRNSIGLARRTAPDGAFERVSPAPVLDRNRHDPFSISYPWVMPDGDGLRMWYGSNLAWGAKPETMAHVIKTARSSDGILWSPSGKVAIGLDGDGEYALSRPCVRRQGDDWRMWYSYRGAAYRIGYARSHDGETWRRQDENAGIEPSATGWDAGAVQYAYVFDHAGRQFMFYNGRNYGIDGFGLAILET